MRVKNSPIIYEFEGLRGLLALWVFVSHALRFCDIHVPLLYQGVLAVDVFMILSGFVIGRLCFLKPEPYLPFLVRRAARLYPAYLIALLSGVVISSIKSNTYASIPWPQEDIVRVVAEHGVEVAHFVPLFISHLLLMHGIFPEEILKNSSTAFVGPGWSLSLEWQFYLIAPALISLLVSRRFQSLTIIGTVLIAIAAPHVLKSYTYLVPSFLPLTLTYFVVGIVSALVYDALKEVKQDLLVIGFGGILCGLTCAAAFWMQALIPFLIWIIAVLASLNIEYPEFRLTSLFLTCKPVKFLGRISYGFYIYHASVYIPIAGFLLAQGVHTKLGVLAGIMLIALPVTLGIAAVSYHFIELPVMRYAKKRLDLKTNLIGVQTA